MEELCGYLQNCYDFYYGFSLNILLRTTGLHQVINVSKIFDKNHDFINSIMMLFT